MEKATSAQLFKQADRQSNEADSHAHKLVHEISDWFNCYTQAGSTRTQALIEGVKEGAASLERAAEEKLAAAGRVVTAVGLELKDENPELVAIGSKIKHMPEHAAHRIQDFYRTRPLAAAAETLLPPVVIIDALIRGGRDTKKPG
ncbi:MAG TPA: hypothetical protein V6C86_03605 [Oculatellaceae cyanobacterium]